MNQHTKQTLQTPLTKHLNPSITSIGLCLDTKIDNGSEQGHEESARHMHSKNGRKITRLLRNNFSFNCVPSLMTHFLPAKVDRSWSRIMGQIRLNWRTMAPSKIRVFCPLSFGFLYIWLRYFFIRFHGRETGFFLNFVVNQRCLRWSCFWVSYCLNSVKRRRIFLIYYVYW